MMAKCRVHSRGRESQINLSGLTESKAYRIVVLPLLVLASNFLFAREPHKVGCFLAFSVILNKLANKGEPGFIRAISFEHDSVSDSTLELADLCPNDPITGYLSSFHVALGLIVSFGCWSRVVDPLP